MDSDSCIISDSLIFNFSSMSFISPVKANLPLLAANIGSVYKSLISVFSSDFIKYLSIPIKLLADN
jgi:hypothetical protein